MEASESDETVLVLVSLLSGEALAEFAAPKRSTVLELHWSRTWAMDGHSHGAGARVEFLN